MPDCFLTWPKLKDFMGYEGTEQEFVDDLETAIEKLYSQTGSKRIPDDVLKYGE